MNIISNARVILLVFYQLSAKTSLKKLRIGTDIRYYLQWLRTTFNNCTKLCCLHETIRLQKPFY